MGLTQTRELHQEVDVNTLRDLIVAGFQAQGKFMTETKEFMIETKERFDCIETDIAEIKEIVKRLDCNT